MAGDTRALARAIRMVEDRDPGIADLLRQVRERAGRARVIGVTGPPGSGKSTLCDQVIERWRAGGHLVGVIAVDPSSPFTGGAILGDRVRMVRHTLDPGVFIRSMAARGHLGGLAAAAREAIRLLDASGRDRCLLETVGVGSVGARGHGDRRHHRGGHHTGQRRRRPDHQGGHPRDRRHLRRQQGRPSRGLQGGARPEGAGPPRQDPRRVVAAGPDDRRGDRGRRRRAGGGHRPPRRHDRRLGGARAPPDRASPRGGRGDRGRASSRARAKCAA